MNLYIAYSSDDNYAMHAGISIISLFENNLEANAITVYIMDNDISNDNKKKLLSIAKKYRRTIEFIKFNNIEEYLGMNIWSDRSLSAMSRLLLCEFIPVEIDKIIYFDSDTIINYSLEEFWKVDIDNYYVAGILDTVFKESKTLVGLKKDDIYINSGVLLINTNKWREERINEQIIGFLKEHKGKVYHTDQGIINAVLRNKILPIHPKYNVLSTQLSFSYNDIIYLYNLEPYYSVSEVKYAKNNPVIIHFTPGLYNRPWVENCNHPLKHIYLRYKNISPWNDISLQSDKRRFHIKILTFIQKNFNIKIYKFIITNMGFIKKMKF